MRRAVLVVAVLIAGCGAHRDSGPAWPKMADKDTDGGESLTPRQGAMSVVAAADDDDDDIKVVAVPAAATPAGAAATAATPAATPAATAPEDTIMVEEIVIEIDD